MGLGMRATLETPHFSLQKNISNLQNENTLEGQNKAKERPALVDDEIERQIDLAYAYDRNQSAEGWDNMWKAVLERLFPSDRYDVTKESHQVKVWNFDFLFVTRKQDSRKLLTALCSCPISRNDKAGWLRKRTLVRSYMTHVGKRVQDGGRMYCLGLVGTDFRWGWMEDGAIEGIDPAIEWDDFDLVESHGSLHQLADHVGRL